MDAVALDWATVNAPSSSRLSRARWHLPRVCITLLQTPHHVRNCSNFVAGQRLGLLAIIALNEWPKQQVMFLVWGPSWEPLESSWDPCRGEMVWPPSEKASRFFRGSQDLVGVHPHGVKLGTLMDEGQQYEKAKAHLNKRPLEERRQAQLQKSLGCQHGSPQAQRKTRLRLKPECLGDS
jgi:hypothetical protein